MTWYRLTVFEDGDKVLNLETDDPEMVKLALAKKLGLKIFAGIADVTDLVNHHE